MKTAAFNFLVYVCVHLKCAPPIDGVFNGDTFVYLQDPKHCLTTLRRRPKGLLQQVVNEAKTAKPHKPHSAGLSYDVFKDVNLEVYDASSLLCMNGLLNFVSQRERFLEPLREFSDALRGFLRARKNYRDALQVLRLTLRRPPDGGAGRSRVVDQEQVTRWLITSIQKIEACKQLKLVD